jgi:protein-arginine kinase activator protein McsA
MQDELIAQEILNILMESGAFRTEEIALETLKTAPQEWIDDLEESASFAAISSLQDALKDALAEKDFERARKLRERINQLSQK